MSRSYERSRSVDVAAPRASVGTPPKIRTHRLLRQVLATDRGGELYRKRQPMIEPVFAQMKFNRGLGRFRRRGRGAVRAEWGLISVTHNLLKLHRHAPAAA
jgi:hypothetical protein